MYIKKELKMKELDNDGNRRIGPDAIRFKHKMDIDDHSNVLTIKGTISHVGLDFVDLIQEDDRVISVLTDKISYVSWLDPQCQGLFGNCHEKRHNDCKCVDFNRRSNHNNGNRHMKHADRKKQMRVCSNCRDKNGRRIYDLKPNTGHINVHQDLKNCPHCQNEHKNRKKDDPHCHDHHRNEHKNRKKDDPHCHDHHHNDCCQQRFTCFCDHVIPFCDDRIELRLAGLIDDLNFQLLQHKGCKVKLDLA
jgi:hypothetical protein